MIRPGRLWWLFRRDWARGWSATWHDYQVCDRMAGWKNPNAKHPLQPVAVHVFTGREQFRLARWMLASWFAWTGRNWEVVLHDDGTLDRSETACYLQAFTKSRLVERAEADDRMATALAPFPLCRQYRVRHPLARKIFDVPVFAEQERIILLDADVLFFSKPAEMLRWVDEGSEGCWFNQDVQEASLVDPKEAEAEWKIKLWPKVNSGICLIYRNAIDLAFCEECLAHTPMLQDNLWRVEQTLFALCASRYGRGGLLPAEYEVSLAWNARPGAAARHYVGAVRDRFYGEGMCRLKKILLPGNGTNSHHG